MPSWMEGWPVLAVLLFFLAGAVVRSQAVYWAGRGVTAGVLRGQGPDAASSAASSAGRPVGRTRRVRTALARRLDSEQVTRARSAIERWGMPVVPLAFLTVGFQSAVFGAAGVLRIGWLRFTLWSLPGAVAWAVLWGGGGMAAVAGALAAARESPLLLAVVVVVVGSLVSAVAARGRRTTRTAADQEVR